MPTFAIELHNEKAGFPPPVGWDRPAYPLSNLTATLAQELSVVITQTYNFREAFEAQGIQGGRINVTEGSKGEFVRLLTKIDITKDGESDRIVDVIQNVLRNLALRVCVDGKAEPETPVGEFLARLRRMPNMHFVG